MTLLRVAFSDSKGRNVNLDRYVATLKPGQLAFLLAEHYGEANVRRHGQSVTLSTGCKSQQAAAEVDREVLGLIKSYNGTT